MVGSTMAESDGSSPATATTTAAAVTTTTPTTTTTASTAAGGATPPPTAATPPATTATPPATTATPPAAATPPPTADRLPAEILVEVFSYLSLADMARAAAVCERWRDLLTRHTAVWRRKEYFTRKKASREEVAAIARTMPRLRCLHVVRDNEFGVHISWPEAAVSLCCDAAYAAVAADTGSPERPPRSTPVPFSVEFDVQRLVVCGAAFPQCLRWVRSETLEAVRVAEQCEGAGTHPASPFYYYREHGRFHCWGPICSFRSAQPAFCVLCAYSHHFNCAGAACPLGVEADDGFDLWCHPDVGRRAGARGRSQQEQCDSGGLEAELEAALRRPLTAHCPALEELTVSGAGLAPADLRLLCAAAAGRLRALRVDSPCLRGLSVLRHLRGSLEELTVADASRLPADAFRELGQLRALRLLRLSRFRAPRTAVAHHTRHLRGLRCVLQKPLAATDAPPADAPPAVDDDFLLE